MTRSRRWMWPVINATSLFLALLLNGLANALPLNGMTTGALSELYPNLFVPMGATFSIWALIYSWLLLFVGYGFVVERAKRDRNPLETIGPWFAVNMVANAAWIVAWHWMAIPVSVGLMGIILASLIVMYLRLRVGISAVCPADRWLIHAPMSVYMGWITVAAIANITTQAVDLGAPAFGQGPAWLTTCMIGAAVLIAGRMLWTRRDGLFALVIMWALLGIHLKQSASEAAGSALVADAALGALGTLCVGMVLVGLRGWRDRG